jgi:hypothetical protein
MAQFDKCSSKAPQWHWLLGALAREWSCVHSPAALLSHMTVLGAEFAVHHPLPAVTHLGDLELAINRLWDERHWGRVTLHDRGSALLIVHADSPLASAFGPTHLAWSVGLLEGIYARWLHDAGAPAELELGCVDLRPDPARHEFMFSAPAGPSRLGASSSEPRSTRARAIARAADHTPSVEIAHE